MNVGRGVRRLALKQDDGAREDKKDRGRLRAVQGAAKKIAAAFPIAPELCEEDRYARTHERDTSNIPRPPPNGKPHDEQDGER